MQVLAEKINEFGEAHDIDNELIGLLLDSIATTFLETINPTKETIMRRLHIFMGVLFIFALAGVPSFAQETPSDLSEAVFYVH